MNVGIGSPGGFVDSDKQTLCAAEDLAEWRNKFADVARDPGKFPPEV